MSDQKPSVDSEIRPKLAVDLSNRVRELLDKTDRTSEEDKMMVHAAHASRFHWREVGAPLEFERGEWQISRVHSTLRRPQAALHHANRCLEICQANGIADFDLAFAYEALARAHATAGRGRQFLTLAEKAAEAIEDKGNREYTLGELAAVKVML